MPTNIAKLAAGLVLFAAAATLLQACSNSLLRNFTEAGVETALDDPLPTPARR